MPDKERKKCIFFGYNFATKSKINTTEFYRFKLFFFAKSPLHDNRLIYIVLGTINNKLYLVLVLVGKSHLGCVPKFVEVR